MPFKCFKCQFYTSTKRYHTQAKQNATSFFDSSFNYIKQHTQLILQDCLYSQGAKRSYANPHPANSSTSNYLQFDYNTNNNILVSDDDSSHKDLEHDLEHEHEHDHHKLLSLILPYGLHQIASVLNNSSYKQSSTKVPIINVSQVLMNSIKLVNPIHQQQLKFNIPRHYIHTFASIIQNQQEQQPQIQHESQPSSPTLVAESDEQVPKYSGPSDEPIAEQSDYTFLYEQTNEIINAYNSDQFEKIHSLYLAIKRNNIIPSRDVYSLTLSSISKRSIDDTMDDKLSNMLNVYQDLIQNKIKPDLEIYSIVINDLLKASIDSITNASISSNGADFFKIAIDIFNASNCHHVQNFNNEIIDQLLVGMNLYPGLISNDALRSYLSNINYTKSHIYYISMINYCKLNKDANLAMELYNDFKIQSESNIGLTDNQFLIYSSLISTLIHADEVTSATKFLDKLLATIKNYEEYDSKLRMLLSSYILALSHKNINKALEIWFQFNSIDWIPEFSYEFYSNLLNQINDYQDASKIYNYMVCLPKSSENKHNLESVLIEPHFIKNSISRFLISAVQFDDKTTVLKVIKESLVKKITFDYTAYPILSQYLQSTELTNKLINRHGILMDDGYEFLTYLTSMKIEMSTDLVKAGDFVEKLVNNYKMYESKNHSGLYAWFENYVFNSSIDLNTLRLCASLIIEFHDLDNYYNQIPNQKTLAFKENLTTFFKTQINNIDESSINSTIIIDAIKLIKDIDEINQQSDGTINFESKL